MKIRIKGNSIRYRLTKSDVSALVENGRLDDKTEFISGTITYAIEQTNAEAMSADFMDGTITLGIPIAELGVWAGTDQVGMEYSMPLANGNSLYLLLEKDFKCIDGDMTEDQSDFFENPHLTC